MAIPEVIPIAYEPWARTKYIGRYEQGQFYGSLTGAFPRWFNLRTMRDQWEEHKRFYAVLHRFDHDGHYIETNAWYEGWGERASQAEAILMGWLDGLPGLSYGPIAIRPFQVVIDDVFFGLVPRVHVDGDRVIERVDLDPEDLCFGPPWDGLYDT